MSDRSVLLENSARGPAAYSKTKSKRREREGVKAGKKKGHKCPKLALSISNSYGSQ
jgi:hypothetical protein